MNKKYEFKIDIIFIFLSISFNICFGCSKELSHRDGSFEYPQHMLWLRNKKILFSNTLLSTGLFDLDAVLSPFILLKGFCQ